MKKSGAHFLRERLVTLSIIAANILLFIISAFTGDLLYGKGAFSAYYLLYEKEWQRLFTSLFLHADVEHLAGNMILLYLAGEIVERYLGKWKFLLLYFASGVSGSLVYALYEHVTGRYAESIGASGAIFGIVGALLVLVVKYKGQYDGITAGRILFMIAYMIYSGLRTAYVNNAAHVGGLLGGVLMMGIYLLLARSMKKEP